MVKEIKSWTKNLGGVETKSLPFTSITAIQKCSANGYTCKSSFQEDFRTYKACTDYDHSVGNYWCYHTDSFFGFNWQLCDSNQACGEQVNLGKEDWTLERKVVRDFFKSKTIRNIKMW